MNPEERIKSWLRGEKKGPYSLELMVTSKCNLGCMMCDIHEHKPRDEKSVISEARYMQIIDEASELSVESIMLSGGEPFLRKDIVDIIKKIKEKGIKGEVITNGTLIDKETAEAIVKADWDEMTISLDGPNRRVNDSLRTKSFDSVIKGIKLINYYKRKYRSQKPGISIATVLSNKNYTSLYGVLKICSKLKVNAFVLQELLLRSKICHELELSKEERKKFDSDIENLMKFANKLGVHTNLKHFVNNEPSVNNNDDNCNNTFLCFAPFVEMSVLEGGEVRHCIASYKTIDSVRNKPLKEIWFGKRMESFRKKLLRREFPEFCKNCCSPRLFQMKEMNKLIKNKMRSK